jgi:hypothetical protein
VGAVAVTALLTAGSWYVLRCVSGCPGCTKTRGVSDDDGDIGVMTAPPELSFRTEVRVSRDGAAAVAVAASGGAAVDNNAETGGTDGLTSQAACYMDEPGSKQQHDLARMMQKQQGSEQLPDSRATSGSIVTR